MAKRLFYSVGSVLLDDIVFPDGQTHMAVLGGGATHAAMGMRIWDDAVGLVASIGRGLPASLEQDLGRVFDLKCMQKADTATPRGWQLYEFDSSRTEVFRTDINEMLDIIPQPESLHPTYAKARGIHLHCEAPDQLQKWIKHLRRNGSDLLLWEPWEPYCLPENRAQIQKLVRNLDVVALSLPEAQQLMELGDPQQIVKQLLTDGANIVALRMGKHGSLVANAHGEIYRIPVYPVEKITDVTGAGNAYCGGFIVGLEKTGALFQAGLYGTISASLVLENIGALLPLEGLRAEAERRLEYLNTLSRQED